MPFSHLNAVLETTAELGARFNDAGKRLYLVGGIVRDQWLDLRADASSDIDLTTNALPAEIKAIVEGWADAIWTQGERFGTIGLRSHGWAFEITTHRAESYTSDSRKPAVAFGDSIETDLSRRDFTINAMAIELPGGELVDPYSGAADLADRLLRTPLSAEISFSDDPLRMLRAARFATRFELAVDEAVVVAATELHERTRIVAIERIGEELKRLLTLADCASGLRFLANTGVLAEVLAYGDPALIAETADRFDHQSDDGLELGLAAVSKLTGGWHVRLAGLLSAVFGPAEAVQKACRRLRLSRDDERVVVGMVRAATSIQPAPSPGTLRRWAAQHDDVESAFALARASQRDDRGEVDSFEAAYRDLAAREDLVNQEPLLDGAAIMSLLDLSTGPEVGQAVKMLREHRFDHGPLTVAAETELLREWWRQRS